jgi:hypothetical protein
MQSSEAVNSVVDKLDSGLFLAGTKLGIRHPPVMPA